MVGNNTCKSKYCEIVKTKTKKREKNQQRQKSSEKISKMEKFFKKKGDNAHYCHVSE